MSAPVVDDALLAYVLDVLARRTDVPMPADEREAYESAAHLSFTEGKRAVHLLRARKIIARVRAEERQQLADLILPHHWRTSQVWGGVRRAACGRCAYGDGVQWLWPCPTRQALTGEAAPESDSALVEWRHCKHCGGFDERLGDVANGG